MRRRLEDTLNEDGLPYTYSIEAAGRMAGLGKNGSYVAARCGEIPTLEFGGIKRVPGKAWRDKLAGDSVVNAASVAP